MTDERTLPSGPETLPLSLGPATEESTELPLGSVVDRYVVVERLGSGSGGVVYSAFDSHLGRRVALKVLALREDPARSPGWRRLVQEAQLVARLDHPHVVTVHDVGFSDGVAFIAMELVDGTDLAQWLQNRASSADDSTRLTREADWRTRIDPLLAAGRGLAAAHRRQVVHGDFKPANVLLGRDGKIRVTDFGVARLHERVPVGLDPACTQDHEVLDSEQWRTTEDDATHHGGLWGTPLYMAPELFDGMRPTIASDIYSLCASVYEAIYAVPPARGRSLMALYAAKLEPPAVPRNMRVPRRVRDLLLRGLDPDPARRPSSVDEVIDALHRAMRPRRRGAVWMAASLTVASLFAAVGVQAWTKEAACDHAEEHLQGIWDRDRELEVRAAMLATEVPSASETWERVEQNLDAYADRWVSIHTRTCLATQRGEQSEVLLDAKMRCLDERKAELGALVDVLAEGDLEVMMAATRAVLDLRPLTDCEHADVRVESQGDKAQQGQAARARDLARARSLAAAGKIDDSDTLAQQVLEQAREDGDTRGEATALHRLGRNARQRSGAVGARDLLEQAIWVAESHKADDVAALAGIDLLKLLSTELGMPKHAVEWAPHVEVAIRRAELGPKEQADFFLSRATALAELGRHDEALDDLEQTAALLENVPDSKTLRGHLTNAFGMLHLDRGEIEEALAYQRESLKIREAVYGSNHPQTAAAMDNVASSLNALRRFDEALELDRRALAIMHATKGNKDPQTITVESNVAATLARMGRLEEAVATYQTAADALAEVYGFEHVNYGGILLSRAGVLGKLDRFDEAVAHVDKALPIIETKVGAEHPWVAFGLINRGTALHHLGRHDEAIRDLERALQILEGRPGTTAEVALGRFGLAQALAASSDDPQVEKRATKLAEQALATWEDAEAEAEAEQIRGWLADR